ncbi:MAG: hypothetical protein JW839_06245 [Candidatus Lokiarchaeota archaeon]|nr:hypothetical protein [Candidatus Lokiarchaeota archaeon]
MEACLVEMSTQREPPEPADSKKDGLWDQIGFHRPLGGFMYNYVIGFVGIVFGVVIGGLLISVLYPYPESKGYRDLAGMVFIWTMPLFDIGVAYGIERFIGEYRIKDPSKMVEYIQFFTWYLMFSSLLKTTVFSVWTFTVITQQNLAYLSWNLLLLSIHHYPGILYLLRSCMAGLQQYHVANTLHALGSEVFDKVFLLCFIYMWRAVGNQNPAIGELMTMAFGTTFAYYMRDFFMFGLQVHFIRPMLRKIGIPLRSLFQPGFSKEVAWTAFKTGISVSVPGIVAQGVAYTVTMMYVDVVAQFTTFSVLSSSASMFVNFLDYFGKIDLTAPFSEAYRNQKLRLSVFYVAQGWKYWGYVNGAMMFMFAAFLNVLAATLLAIPGLEYYAMIGLFLLPWWIYKFFLPVAEHGDMILVGAMRLKAFQSFRIAEEAAKLAWVALMLYAFRWQEGGTQAIAFVFMLATAVPQWIKVCLVWTFIRRKLLPYSIPVWQAIVAPLASGVIVYGIVTAYLQFVHALFVPSIGPVFAGIISIVIILVTCPTMVFPFFYGLLGGWDSFGLETYQKAVSMAGPSKAFYRMASRVTAWAARHSPLTNRFPIPHDAAIEEIKQLTGMKKKLPGAA